MRLLAGFPIASVVSADQGGGRLQSTGPWASTCQQIHLSPQSKRREERPLFLPRKTSFVVHMGFIKTILVKTQQYFKYNSMGWFFF